MSVEIPQAIPLAVALPDVAFEGDPMGDGLRNLYRRGELTDVLLTCEGKRFPAHRVALAAQSDIFKEGFSGLTGSQQEVRLPDIRKCQAVKFMLDFFYQVRPLEFPESDSQAQDIAKDVLRLSNNFRLPALRDIVVQWLAKGLSTDNVVERLTLCDEFELTKLKDLIMEQLTNNNQALAQVASSPQIMQHPKLMQAMLQLVASAAEPKPGASDTKRHSEELTPERLSPSSKLPSLDTAQKPKKRLPQQDSNKPAHSHSRATPIGSAAPAAAAKKRARK